MSDYVIFSDSCSDLTPEILKEIDVSIIPMKFTVKGASYENYPDERELSSREFYDMVRGGEMPTTSQVNSTEFIDIFEPLLREGKDILYIAFSSGLSGTYNNSCIAAEELHEKYPQRKMITVDSLAASMGEGLLVYLAAKKREEGLGIEELAKWVEENRNHLCHWFTVDDLNHLKRGGRVSSAAALFGTMLGIKPVLHVDDEGHLIPVSKVRGRKASLDALVKEMEKAVTDAHTVFVSHGDSLDDAKYVAEQVKSKFHSKEIRLNHIGPVIGAHSGPGTIALFFLGEHK